MSNKEAFKRLKGLGEEKVEKVDHMLRSGKPASEVATIIQEAWGDLNEIGHVSVKKMLERYRKTELRQKVIEKATATNKDVSLYVLSKRLDALDEMQELVDIQKGRFMKALGREQSMPDGMLIKQVSDEARLLKEFLLELGKMQLETGVMKRAPKTVSGTVMDADGTVRHFEWSEEQEQLYKELDDVDYALIEG